ncbi:MAG: helix-turn-helix domain-containing protein [Planktothrix sp.]
MNIEQISQSWQNIAPLLIPILSEEDCDLREEQLKQLIKLNKQKKDPQIAHLIRCIALTIEEYEKQEFPLEKASGIEVIQYLMAEHGLKESDLPEIGNQGLVSDVLTGNQALNLTMIKALAKRFGVTEQTFLG